MCVKNKFVYTLAFVLVIIITTASSVFALDPKKTINQYRQSAWTRQNGLPTNSVNTIIQSHDGYIWLGTSAGLFRFDGVNFTLISTDPADNKNLETISALYEASDSSMWIGTQFNFVCHLKDGKIVRYGESDGVGGKNIRTILESREKQIWLGTSYGLYKRYQGSFISIPVNPSDVIGLVEDSAHQIWVATHDGIRVFNSTSQLPVLRYSLKEQLPNISTTALYADRHGAVWIGTASGLVCSRNGKIVVYNVEQGLADNHINAIYEDRDDNIWIGTQRGLSRLSQGKWSTFKDSDGLTDNNVLAFVEDQEGNLWVCTSNGLNLFKDVNLITYTTYEGFSSNFISSVIETNDGSMYFLSDQSASITQLKNNKIRIYNNIPIGPAFTARDGSLWIGQTGLLMNFKDGLLKRYDASSGLPLKWISAIGEDSASMLIYLDGIGIRRFDHGTLKPYLLGGGKQDESTKYVACFYNDPNGILWIGRSCGLWKIEHGTSTVVGEADGMTDVWMNYIYDDRQGSLWVASPSNGLLRYKNGRFTSYNTKNGLFTNEIYCVLGDDDGNLWVSSSRGIGRVQRNELEDYAEGKIKTISSRVYTVEDGMKTGECFGQWQPAGWKAHDGSLWFATRKGAVRIDPKFFQRNELPPPVLIENVVIDQEMVAGNQRITLSPGKDKIEFHYTALSFVVPERVLFRYKLEGYDHNWVDAGTRRIAYYTNLSPGEYRFRVRACNNDGLWNQTGASVAFELKPYFYQSLWFYGLILVAIGGAGFGIYRLRVWQLLTREKELKLSVDDALARIKVLNGLIPICASCKKIRDDKGYWNQLENYIHEHSEATFSHGVCPECAEKLYGKYYTQLKKQREDEGAKSAPTDLSKK